MATSDIKIKYNGKWPCLCSGHLEVWIGEDYYDFGEYSLISGGAIHRNINWEMWATEGPWEISNFPPNFPIDRQEDLLKVINAEIPLGCCGGCI